jgi:hypothetical protein
MNIHAISITTTEVSDSEGMDTVLPADLPVDRVIADGAYYSIERTEALSSAGVTPVIPPSAHVVVHGNDQTRWHDQIVKYIDEKGIYGFLARCMGTHARPNKVAPERCVWGADWPHPDLLNGMPR